jgi:hypothetical protein
MKKTSKDVKIFKSFREQEASDIRYYAGLSPEERQRIARELRERYYGKEALKVRDVRRAR